MKHKIAEMRGAWRRLACELLVPAKLSDADFEAVLLARADPTQAAFRARLPMIVAAFKDTVQSEIGEYAGKDIPAQMAGETRYTDPFMRDIGRMNRVLFGADEAWKYTRVQFADEARRLINHLHYDRGHPFSPLYVGRIGSRPTLSMRGDAQDTATPEMRALMKRAMPQSWTPCERQTDKERRERRIGRALDEMQKREYLLPLPLGQVAILLASEREEFATLHCSSPARGQKESFSALFHALGLMP